MGRCTAVPAGAADPRNVCVDQGPQSCGTDGNCDGAGGCRTYDPGTICARRALRQQRLHAALDLQRDRPVRRARRQRLRPVRLQRRPLLRPRARPTRSCSPGKACSDNSCGLKPNGAFCSDKRECSSGNCAQGVCCATACASACKSCALPASMGVCTNVPDGQPDPTGTCLDGGAASCGTNGKCQAGACQSYAQGTPCEAATCPASTTTLTPAGLCDGAGTCSVAGRDLLLPVPVRRRGVQVDLHGRRRLRVARASAATARAASSPTARSAATAPSARAASAPRGSAARPPARARACRARCPAAPGTCKPVPAGAVDPAGQCRDQGAASCGTDGFCDGAGACQLYAAGTQCAPPACPAGTTHRDARAHLRRRRHVQARHDASRARPTPATAPAAASACGMRRRLRQRHGLQRRLLRQEAPRPDLRGAGANATAATASTASAARRPAAAPARRATWPGRPARASRSRRARWSRTAAAPPRRPADSTAPATAAARCRPMPAGTSCGTASCSGSTSTPVGTCDGAGTCSQSPVSCAPYMCGTGACQTTCADDRGLRRRLHLPGRARART